MVSAIAVRDGVQLEPVNSICKRIIGKRVAPSTLWRWIKTGIRGGKLEAVHVNGTWHCTAEAFADFINRQTAAQFAAREHSEDVTDEQLRAEGLL
ncbi:DUF1580 domain-containing protein [Planctomicrobium sp. SH664]|uniref:DUF1580 domain-containing protein n=1 Tax=Planctomicrobium sp. SH664 TaxID=3448125 RepID=UPI003F5BD041